MNTKMRSLTIFLVISFLFFGIKGAVAEENKHCEKNYTKQGSSFFNKEGMEEKTWVKFNKPTHQALTAAIAAVPDAGWPAVFVDKDKGFIEARDYYKPVLGGKHAIGEVLISIEVKQDRTDSVVKVKTLVFKPGYKADNSMCRYLDAVERILKGY